MYELYKEVPVTDDVNSATEAEKVTDATFSYSGNDNSTATLEYTIPGTACEVYILHEGCYNDEFCAGVASVTGASSGVLGSTVAQTPSNNDDDYNDDGFGDINSQWYVAWGIFIAYFFGALLLCLTLDLSGCLDGVARKIGDTAHDTFVKYHYNSQKFLSQKKNHGITSDFISSKYSEKREIKTGPCSCHPDVNYTPEFFARLLEAKFYFGAKGVWFPDGLKIFNPLRCASYSFPIGMVEDYVFFLCNNHTVLSMFMCTRGHPFSRSSKRIAFFGQNCFAFFIAKLLKVLFANDQIAISLLSTFVVAPLSLLVNKFFYALLVCPCVSMNTRNNRDGGFYGPYYSCCRCIVDCGKAIAYPAALFGLGFLVFVALFTSTNKQAAMQIARYAYAVNVEAAVINLATCAMSFWSGRATYKFKVYGHSAYEVGSWFKEYLEAWDEKQETVPHIVTENQRLLSCIPEKYLSVTVYRTTGEFGQGQGQSGDLKKDIEMGGTPHSPAPPDEVIAFVVSPSTSQENITAKPGEESPLKPMPTAGEGGMQIVGSEGAATSGENGSNLYISLPGSDQQPQQQQAPVVAVKKTWFGGTNKVTPV
eukprot:gene30538-37776_t